MHLQKKEVHPVDFFKRLPESELDIMLAVWTAGSAGLFALAFRKKGVDN